MADLAIKKLKAKTRLEKLQKVSISVKSNRILRKILEETPRLESILKESASADEALMGMRDWLSEYFAEHPVASDFYKGKIKGREGFAELKWQDLAAIRLMDYVDHAGMYFEDQNLRGEMIGTNPIKLLWLAVKEGRGGADVAFFMDALHLFRQFTGRVKYNPPKKEEVLSWMDRHPSGLHPKVIKARKRNRDRILKVIIKKLENGDLKSNRYQLDPELTEEQKYLKAREWWNEMAFHLKFAIRTPKMLNEMMGHSLSNETMRLLGDAYKEGIPIFVNPYYLSLLNVTEPEFAPGSDLAIRDYIINSRELVSEFGHIVAWEKEDIVEPGEPNAAGWILPYLHNVHRRYPEVAILIPDTMGRACGGLCVSCQRMYDFQSGHLNFNLKKLQPKETWPQKLNRLMEYFEEDTQLRDILITGGDALMSSDISLKRILNEIYEMAKRKAEDNKLRENGKKYAEFLRIRLGTRLPVFLPQRITPELVNILSEFKTKASEIGIRQFVIQTHFETAMEVTPEAKKAIERLLSAGWIVTNQQVFTAAASRRGHTAKLRKVLNEVGVLTYYTFSVKGYKENYHNFATNERAIQEQIEEKVIGQVPDEYIDQIKELPNDASKLLEGIESIKEKAGIPFLGTDRNVLNLPGVGKSLTFRTIGLTRDGRRVLEFDHDHNRNHSPVVNEMGKVIIIESKSVWDYMLQLEEMGEELEEYESVFGYSIGETEKLTPIYQYPSYDFETTDELTNFQSMDESD